MIQFVTGDIFESSAQALVNTVNTVGVMGKGIALQFKQAYPNNFKAYKDACKRNEIQVGKLFITQDSNLHTCQKLIINFPTKQHWRNPSEYIFIEKGLNDLIRVIDEYQIQSIAIPPLGAGNGGLTWEKVKKMICSKLEPLDINIYVYEPIEQIQERLKKDRVNLTPARALLLFVLYDLVRHGEYVSEFSSEKVSYFLQRFGAKQYFNLAFEPYFYGPYSGRVKYVLNALNGSYLMGYSDMNAKPFEPLVLVADGFPVVKEYIESRPELLEIAKDTTQFLSGFYSDFALELLSSIDYLSDENRTLEKTVIYEKLEKWSDGKKSMFNDPKYLHISFKHLEKTFLLSERY